MERLESLLENLSKSYDSTAVLACSVFGIIRMVRKGKHEQYEGLRGDNMPYSVIGKLKRN